MRPWVLSVKTEVVAALGSFGKQNLSPGEKLLAEPWRLDGHSVGQPKDVPRRRASPPPPKRHVGLLASWQASLIDRCHVAAAAAASRDTRGIQGRWRPWTTILGLVSTTVGGRCRRTTAPQMAGSASRAELRCLLRRRSNGPPPESRPSLALVAEAGRELALIMGAFGFSTSVCIYNRSERKDEKLAAKCGKSSLLTLP